MTFKFKASTETITKITSLLSKFPSEEKVLKQIEKKEQLLINCYKLLYKIKNMSTPSKGLLEQIKSNIRLYLDIIEKERKNLQIFKQNISPHIFRLLKQKATEEYKQKFNELDLQTTKTCEVLLEFIEVNIDKNQEMLEELAKNEDLENVFQKFKEQLKHQKRVIEEIDLKEEIQSLVDLLKQVRRPKDIVGTNNLNDTREVALALSVAASILLIMSSLMIHPDAALLSIAPISGIFYTLKSYFNPNTSEKTIKKSLELVFATREIDKRIL